MSISQLVTTKVGNCDFAYYDSGGISGKAIIIIHGNTYHGGTFLTLFPYASSHNIRIILVQRRLYPGTTPYDDDETRIMLSGSEGERHKVMDNDGELLALFVDNMIREHDLGKVAVVGWSQGAISINLIADAIHRIESEPRQRLQEHVCALIYWDPPSISVGLVDPPTGGYLPLFDPNLPPDQRGPEFGKWVSYHYPHPDLASRDPAKLLYKLDAPVKPPSFSQVTREQLLTMVDFSANTRGDAATGQLTYKPILRNRLQRALLDIDVRKAWKNAKFGCVYGDQSVWNVQWAVWSFEKLTKEAGEDLSIEFKVMEGIS